MNWIADRFCFIWFLGRNARMDLVSSDLGLVTDLLVLLIR